MRISDWSSDVCSSDIHTHPERHWTTASMAESAGMSRSLFCKSFREAVGATPIHYLKTVRLELAASLLRQTGLPLSEVAHRVGRSEEHTSELQSLMRISYAVFCLKNKIYRQQR